MKRNLKNLVLLCLTLPLLTSCSRADETPKLVLPSSQISPTTLDDATTRDLREIDALYEGVYPWLAKLYDPQSGGFYANLATRDAPDFGSDIEDTAFALTFLRDDGLLETMPANVRQKMVEFFQSRQDPKTGFFFDTHHREVFENERTLMRTLRFTMEGLKMLDAKPLYALPGARAAMPETAHLQSEAAFTKWLEARPWDKAWGALDQIYQQTALLKSLPQEKQTRFIALTAEYLRQKQDAKTGLIGGGTPIVKISGAAKLGWFLDEFGLPIARADALANTTLQWYRTNPEAAQVTMIRNPIEHLADLQPFLEQPMSETDKRLAIRETLRSLPRFRQKDGAFSMGLKEFFLGPHDWRVAKAKGAQSDINGTAMAQKSRASVYRLLGVVLPKMAGADEFWRLIEQNAAR